MAQVQGKVVLQATLDTKPFETELSKLEKKSNDKEMQIKVQTEQVELAKQKIAELEKQMDQIENEFSDIGESTNRYNELDFKFNEGTITDDERLEYASLEMEGIGKQAGALEDKLVKISNEREKAVAILNQEEQKLQNLNQQYTDINEKIKEEQRLSAQRQTLENIGESAPTVSREALSTNDLARTRAEVQDMQKEYNKIIAQIEYLEKTDAQSPLLDNMRKQAESTGKKLDSLILKQNKLQEKEGIPGTGRIQSALENANKGMDGVGSKLTSVIAKVGRWAIALFGVTSMLTLIRSAMSIITQYDTELAGKIEYIRFALAMTVKPLVEWIVNAVYKIISLFGYLIKLLTGVNIFKKSGIKDFEKATAGASSNMASAVKSAEELNQVTAFDEINKLEDTKTSTPSGGGAGGGGSLGMPDFDFSKAEETAKAFIKRMKDKWKEIGDVMKKSLENPEMFTELYGEWDQLMMGITEMAYGIWLAFQGCFDLIAGAGKLLVGLLQGDWDMVKEGAKQMWNGVKEIISSIYFFLKGQLDTLMGFIKGFAVNVKNVISTAWEEIKSKFAQKFFSTKIGQAVKDIKSVLSGANLPQAFEIIWNAIKSKARDFAVSLGQIVATKFGSAINSFLSWAERQLNKPINTINSLISTISKIPGVGKISRLSTISLPRLAQGGIINNPGHGVPVGGAIGGEYGAEAVLPISDPAIMEQLGESIGRHVTVVSYNTIEVDGEIMTKSVNRTNARDEFVRNR